MEISAKNISKTYGSKDTYVEALKPCNFTIKSGEQLAITGSSGSGKSTLLHLLGSLDRPTSGKILYDSQEIPFKNENELSEFRLRNIGFVFQFYNLLPELTAYENIVLPALLDGKQTDEIHIESICKKLELTERLNHFPGQLSGGQQQRVAIARALTNNPQILLCDEPTGNLDSNNGYMVIELLNETAKNLNVTLIVVTHDISIAKQYSRIIVIKDGEVGGDI
ncbi:MAG: ABC transporter ATP-binding protein [Clostridiales bacterium]|jgi:putative ABC transport system ATP-binding protein|nr:ABC transporter ATP-binding protein [Clostridiales bacterium]